jgi:hypothetical protein
MKKLAVMMLLFAMAAELCWAGLGSNKAMYVGGTLNQIKEGTEGKSSTRDEKVFTFSYKKDKLDIPYDQIDSVEYGQKAGRRLGVAVVVNPIFILSHKRKHFLTVNFKDKDDKQQAAVFELGKDIVRTTLASMEARTGRKIEYQDEEARASGKGN